MNVMEGPVCSLRTSFQFEGIPHILESIFWQLDAKSILRAKQVCCLWKQTVKKLERKKHLWRHLCLNDIYRASLIDIIGFNPQSQHFDLKRVSDGRSGYTEDLWQNVYRSWKAGQLLDHCKKESFEPVLPVKGPYVWNNIALIGAYIYILYFSVLYVWNVDVGNEMIFHKRFTHRRLHGQIYTYLQNPLCKFSEHQHMEQHSLLIPIDNAIQWWTFSNEQFKLMATLEESFYCVGVWDNLLVTCCNVITVYVLERKESQCNFRKINESLQMFHRNHKFRIQVWDDKFLIYSDVSEPTINVYSLDDFTRLAVLPFETPIYQDSRMFGDFLIYSDLTTLCIQNIKTGKMANMF
ncbi:uncharacterized protein [Antedon mediterranea]|uniref:uncharacterized protein n=1 Tax=Antedon mediterranea TaxID=105859 RepID=UPI003AF89846